MQMRCAHNKMKLGRYNRATPSL